MEIKSVSQTPAAATDSASDARQKTQISGFEAALKKAAESGDKTALKKACQDFESIFVQMVFKNMRSTVPEDGLFEKSQAQSIFEGMLDEELSKKVSSAGGMGLADILYEQLQKKYGTDSESSGSSTLDLKG